MFLDVGAVFDSVNRSLLRHLFLRKEVPGEYVAVLKELYRHTSGRSKAYDQL